MSGEINNREYRQKVLKEIISDLHAGKTVEEVRDKCQDIDGCLPKKSPMRNRH